MLGEDAPTLTLVDLLKLHCPCMTGSYWHDLLKTEVAFSAHDRRLKILHNIFF
jgi:hypothetical protein